MNWIWGAPKQVETTTLAGVAGTRPPTMEQDPEVIVLAKKIYIKWMNDARWMTRPSTQPVAYFWAELAARAALGK